MPACARKEIIRQGAPGIFHCWNRCVRRGWLLGTDPLTGIDHNERRGWIIERLKLLVRCFAIDVAFHAIMSNHVHLVLRVNPRLVKRMGDQEVARRWLRAYPGKRVLDDQWIEPSQEQVEKLARNKKRIAKLRKRLANVSWFMAAFSEHIARKANLSDNCDGRFWSGRFFCREVTSEAALLICGMYVDLNQIRAGETISPESSNHCSIWWRVEAAKRAATDLNRGAESTVDIAAWLAPLTLAPTDLGEVPSTTGCRSSDKGLLSISLEDYLRLLDYVGRHKRSDKRGAIPADLAPILERLGLRDEDLAETVDNFPNVFRRIAGSAKQMYERAKEVGRQWFHGVRAAAKVFVEQAESG